MYFQTLRFVKEDLFLKKYGKMKRGKQATLHFKRCITKVAVWKSTLKWNVLWRHVRGKQVTLHFKRCVLKKYGKMKCLMTSCTRKTSNVAVWKRTVKWNVLWRYVRGKQVTLHFKRCGLKKYGKMICGKPESYRTQNSSKYVYVESCC